MLADPLSLSGAPFLVQNEVTQVFPMRKSLKMREAFFIKEGGMFGWFKPERRERRRKVRQARKHVEERARRFLKRYLEADDTRKPQFYRAVEEISRNCQPAELSSAAASLDDSRIAEAASQAAMQMEMDHNRRIDEEGNQISDFVTDACATVAVAYHRAAAVYVEDQEMQELGTAAVHLLTMATSYMIAQRE
jgi:hypothetical protein